MAQLTVMKFGGTSVDDGMQVRELVQKESLKSKPIAVVSAFSGDTNKLLGMAAQGHKDIAELRLSLRTVAHAAIGKAQPIVRRTKEVILPFYRDIEEVLREVEEIDSSAQAETGKLKIEDRIVGLGEIFSARALAAAFMTKSKAGEMYEAVNLADLMHESDMTTTEVNQNAGILYDKISRGISDRVRKVLARGATPILTGYVGKIPGGILQTIDRGYTDTTAAMTAVGLAESGGDDVSLQIWKEVPGLLSGDPRIVEPNFATRKPRLSKDFTTALLRPIVSMNEAAELTDFGNMKAINAVAIDVLMHSARRIDFSVRNTFEPDGVGTRITEEGDSANTGIRFIAGKEGQCAITVRNTGRARREGWAARIFDLCDDLGVSVDVISTSGSTLSFSLDAKDPKRQELMEKIKSQQLGTTKPRPNLALVCCIGTGMENEVGLLSKVSGVLARNDIDIIFDSGHPEDNISLLIPEGDYKKAVECLHKELIEI